MPGSGGSPAGGSVRPGPGGGGGPSRAGGSGAIPGVKSGGDGCGASGTVRAPGGAGGNGTCRITPSCQLKHALHAAREAFFAVLDGYSIDDLVAGNSGLRHILTGDAA